jgi:hypothetical protein
MCPISWGQYNAEEAASLERTLHYSAATLDGKTIEKFSTRLANINVTLAQLRLKKQKAAAAQQALQAFSEKLGDVPAVWHDLGIENQRRFVQLVTEKLTLTKPAPNWLRLEIVWFWPDAPNSILYIWQRRGQGEAWTDEENARLRMLYPHADRETDLHALPRRNWQGICNQASRLHLARPYQFTNSPLHRLVSVHDAAFMAQAGIVFDAENPYQRVWWIYAVQRNTMRSAPSFSSSMSWRSG